MIERWWVDLDGFEDAQVAEAVDDDDRRRSARLRDPLVARRRLARRAATRLILGDIGATRRCRTCGSATHGRLEMDGPGDLSVS